MPHQEDVWAFRAQADGSFRHGHVAVLGAIGKLDPLPIVTLELHKHNYTLTAPPLGLFVVFQHGQPSHSFKSQTLPGGLSWKV